MSPNLYLATLGPVSEVFGLLVVIAVFALLRAQADRRAYFTTWEKAWVFLATGLVAGVLYERFIDPESIFYPVSATTSFVVAAVYLGARAAALAMIVTGVQLFVRGSATPWLMMAAAIALNTLPPSRHSLGTRAASAGFAGPALLGVTLAVFYWLQRAGASITAAPWAVRYARYGFYTEQLLNFFTAWAMVRILVEDGRRENHDARARMKLLQNGSTWPTCTTCARCSSGAARSKARWGSSSRAPASALSCACR